MQRLRGGDAYYLTIETPVQHMHTIKVAVLDPSTSPDGYSFERLRDHLAGHLLRLPPFRWRLVPIPLSLFHPFWADQADFDVRQHIHRLTAPAPGGSRELCGIVSRIASEPLDRNRPLWEVWIVEGLDHGQVALVFKIHHALADGQASVQLLMDAFEGPDDAARFTPRQADVVPSPLALAIGAVSPVLRLLAGVPALLARTARATRSDRRQRAHKPRREALRSPEMPAAFSAPPTRFNRPLTPNRSYACATVSLADVKSIKDAFGCTVNDVVLCVAGGAVRAYLERHGELPSDSLTASIPVSMRSEAELRDWGNRLSSIYALLHTNVIDPAARLRAIHQSTQAAKSQHDARDPQLLQAWWNYGPPAIGTLRALSWLAGVMTGHPPYNLFVSTVRGPSRPLYCDRARLVALHSMGPIEYQMGLSITAWSYLDQLTFGVVGCREYVPDAWELADRIPDQVDALRKAADR